MPDIELAIKIDEQTYNNLVRNEYSRADVIAIHAAITNATAFSKQETGYWIRVPDEDTLYCSKCNCRLDDEQTYLPLNFCPNCGIKMVRRLYLARTSK